ncbi:hypothetical protein NDU88_004455 [Pleurodeles waltl]|uniref:Uncharacterized protein n=1 Tax=Pleurodeles waltl TaxID=8319 RepID=A0AAV7MYH1_PLEWA|nr:hypothetical protein NDU88_004455 [Pleurodeles waltl]
MAEGGQPLEQGEISCPSALHRRWGSSHLVNRIPDLGLRSAGQQAGGQQRMEDSGVIQQHSATALGVGVLALLELGQRYKFGFWVFGHPVSD